MLGLGLGLHKNTFVGGGIDPNQLIINDFKSRVLADGGTFEAEQCLKDSLPALIKNEPSLAVTPNAKEVGKLFSITPTDGTGDLYVVRATTATYVGADGLIKTALENEVRFDYTNRSCPSILIEPQMTNSWTNNNSDNGYVSNVDSIKGSTIPNAFGEGINGFQYSFTGGSVFISSNNSIRVFDTRNFPIQRFCLFIKNPSSDFLGINVLNVGQVRYKFSTLEVDNYSLGSIRKINNDTYALYIHNDNSATGQFTQIRVALIEQFENYITIPGSAIIGLGYQQGLSSGSLPNVYSPIITTASSVTRNIDLISKINISDLIGQIEGSIYCEIEHLTFNQNSAIFVIQNNSNQLQNRLGFRYDASTGFLNAFIRVGSSFIVNLSGIEPIIGEKYKMCFTYNQIEQKLFINGVLVNSRTGSYTQPATLDQCQLGNMVNNTAPSSVLLLSALIIKTKISHTEAIQLTTL